MTQAVSRVEGCAPAALISAPGSGQGKSLITAGLARLHRNAGRRVRVFKFGPDYLDPMILARASGAPVYQLQPWMTGEAECRWRLAEAARDADLVLVEGAMGLFDGSPSSADLAVLCGLPVIPVIDASGMAQTFAALAQGLSDYRPELRARQLIANRVGSPRHGEMLAEALPPSLSLLGAVPRHPDLALPERHLGLVQAEELIDLDRRLDAVAAVLAEAGLDRLPEAVTLSANCPAPPPALLAGRRIAVARDAAFGFLYQANLDLLTAMGAELCFFSPLNDRTLPEAEALWLPGGYPEQHGGALSSNLAMRASIRDHHRQGKPILAECGGLMYCMETLVDNKGRRHAMLGLLPGAARMMERLQGLGMHALSLPRGQLRGHTFHYSRLETPRVPDQHSEKQSGTGGEPVFHQGNLTASYFHGYFSSAPEAVAALFVGDKDHA